MSSSSPASTGFCNSCRDYCSNLSPSGTCRECRQICAACSKDYGEDLALDCNNEFHTCPACQAQCAREHAEDMAEHAAKLAAELADGFNPVQTVEEWFKSNPSGTTGDCLVALGAAHPEKQECIYDAAIARARKTRPVS